MRIDLSFLGTKMTGAAYGDREGRIMPASSNFLTSASSMERSLMLLRYGCEKIGIRESRVISCLL
jgi:hypothetical protein